MRFTTKFCSLILVAILGSLGLAACDANDGPMEDAGENIDEAADDMKDSMDEVEDEMN